MQDLYNYMMNLPSDHLLPPILFLLAFLRASYHRSSLYMKAMNRRWYILTILFIDMQHMVTFITEKTFYMVKEATHSTFTFFKPCTVWDVLTVYFSPQFSLVFQPLYHWSLNSLVVFQSHQDPLYLKHETKSYFIITHKIIPYPLINWWNIPRYLIQMLRMPSYLPSSCGPHCHSALPGGYWWWWHSETWMWRMILGHSPHQTLSPSPCDSSCSSWILLN